MKPRRPRRRSCLIVQGFTPTNSAARRTFNNLGKPLGLSMGGPPGEHWKPKAPHLAKGLSNSQELEQGWHLDEPPPSHRDHLELAALDEFIELSPTHAGGLA